MKTGGLRQVLTFICHGHHRTVSGFQGHTSQFRRRPAPDLGASSATDHIVGLLPVADHMVILLDTDKLIGYDLMDARVVAVAPPLAAAA
jgi:hypothetical protein